MPGLKLNDTIGEIGHSEGWTVEERALIIDEMNRILTDPAFKNSKRCLALFRRLVDRSLAGDQDAVKERTLGAEVFGRAPDYDTAADPVVRMTANEIRKRLAQWYQESDQHHQVKVRLNAGTYLLKFEFTQSEFVPESLELEAKLPLPDALVLPETQTQSAHQADTQTVTESDTQAEVIAPAAAARSRSKWIWGTAAIFVVALAVALSLHSFDVFQSRQYLVWKPLLNSTTPVILSVSEESPQEIADGPLQWQLSAQEIANSVAPVGTPAQNANTITTMADAAAAQMITKWLTSHGQNSVLRGSSALNIRDFRQQSLVLIGGFNPWSLALLSDLRYSIRIDATTHAIWIQDAQNASKRDWMIDGNGQPKDVDYAIISRLFDVETGHWILSLGGLRKQGTRAARNLLIDSSFAKLLPKEIKATGNFQIVLKTNVINESAGPPQILAVHTW